MEIIISSAFILASLIPAYFLGCFNLKYINYYTIFFWLPLILCIVGSFIIYSGLVDDSFFISPIKDHIESKKLALILTSTSFFITIFSSWITEILIKKPIKGQLLKINWKSYSEKSFIDSPRITYAFLWILTLLLIAYYIYTISPAPLYLALINSPATEVAIRRIEVTKDYTGIGYLKTLALTLPYILTYYSISEFLNKRSSLLLLFFSVFISIFTILLNGEKAPILFYLIGIMVSISLSKIIKVKFLILSSILLIIMVLFLYIILFEFSGINYLIYLITERIFIAQEAAMFYATVYFSSHDFIGLSSMQNIVTDTLLIQQTPRASEIFMVEYLPEMLSNGGWNVNGYFAHEAYSNFGITGVILGSVYAGVMNAILCMYFRSRKKNSLNLSFFSFYSISVTTILTSFNYMLFNTQLILLFIIYLFICLFTNYVSNRKTSSNGR